MRDPYGTSYQPALVCIARKTGWHMGQVDRRQTDPRNWQSNVCHVPVTCRFLSIYGTVSHSCCARCLHVQNHHLHCQCTATYCCTAADIRLRKPGGYAGSPHSPGGGKWTLSLQRFSLLQELCDHLIYRFPTGEDEPGNDFRILL